MRRSLFVPALTLLFACQPPPEVGGGADEPSIELIAPPEDVGEIALQADGTLQFDVAVDLDGIQFVRPSVSNGIAVEGQGHYHFHLNNEYLGPPEEQLMHYTSEVDEFPAGSAMQVRVTLATNDHQDLDQFENWEDVVEFDVIAAP